MYLIYFHNENVIHRKSLGFVFEIMNELQGKGIPTGRIGQTKVRRADGE